MAEPVQGKEPNRTSEGDEPDKDTTEVSEVDNLGTPGTPIMPDQATAGYPHEEAESGRPQEGTAGPNAAPRDGRPEKADNPRS